MANWILVKKDIFNANGIILGPDNGNLGCGERGGLQIAEAIGL